jgi:hypothetical protein
MNHQQFREWLPLMVYGELNERSARLMDEHLKGCPGCRNELQEIQKLHSALSTQEASEPSEHQLMEARHQFRAALRAERSRVSFWERIRDQVAVQMPDYRQVLAAVATLLIGVFIGYVTFGRNTPNTGVTSARGNPSSPAAMAPFDSGDTQITNVRFQDSDAKDGQVEFSFDATRPMRIKGNINDEHIQKVLTYALVNSQNPGVRLRAVSAFGSQERTAPENDVKQALITAMKSDDNPGVRKEALEVLQKFPMDEEIKQALLYVLVHDRMAGMRVAAIKSLEAEGQRDKDVLDVLRQKIQSDDNDYIRMKARDVLQEVKQQQ